MSNTTRLRYRAHLVNKNYKFVRTSEETYHASAAETNRLVRSIGFPYFT
jgi:hypothetical protein